MIYQFESEKLTAEDIRESMAVLKAIRCSREGIARKVLPTWAQPYRAIDKAVILSLESLERDLAAIPKTETTSDTCWYCSGIQDHKIVSVRTVFDEFGRELPAYDTPYNYCPNCGRRLGETP